MGIARDLKKLTIGQCIYELEPLLTEGEYGSPVVFSLVIRLLNVWDNPDVDAVLLKRYFRLRFTVLLGLHLY